MPDLADLKIITKAYFLRPRSQAVRQGSAKPLHAGSIPAVASKILFNYYLSLTFYIMKKRKESKLNFAAADRKDNRPGSKPLGNDYNNWSNYDADFIGKNDPKRRWQDLSNISDVTEDGFAGSNTDQETDPAEIARNIMAEEALTDEEIDEFDQERLAEGEKHNKELARTWKTVPQPQVLKGVGKYDPAIKNIAVKREASELKAREKAERIKLFKEKLSGQKETDKQAAETYDPAVTETGQVEQLEKAERIKLFKEKLSGQKGTDKRVA